MKSVLLRILSKQLILKIWSNDHQGSLLIGININSFLTAFLKAVLSKVTPFL